MAYSAEDRRLGDARRPVYVTGGHLSQFWRQASTSSAAATRLATGVKAHTGERGMWSRNSLTERLNLEWPILQAPMGDKTTPALAGAVSNAGALGGLGMSGLTADTVRRRIEGFRQLSAGSLNVNYLLWEHTGDLTGAGTTMRGRLQTLYDTKKLGAVPVPVGSESAVDFDHLSVLKDTSPEVISFHFGLPAPKICRELKANGIFLICSATTVAEALALEASGADANLVSANNQKPNFHQKGLCLSISTIKII